MFFMCYYNNVERGQDMNILVFDTETISLNRPYIYNVGYVIADEKTGKTLVKRDLVIKQVWENKPLLSTAYYSYKKPLYISALRGRKAKLVHWGEMCRIMCKDIQRYNVLHAYAYNSPFDERAFYFNHCYFMNKRRPLDNVFVHNIMDEVKPILKQDNYITFCTQNDYLTKTGRPQKTAESMYAYLTNNPNYQEEHTALADSEIELYIHLHCKKKEE